jgi:hypothetical protein
MTASSGKQLLLLAATKVCFPPFMPRIISLQWTSRAPQACRGSMEPKPDIAELLTDLTAHCEDAAGLAAEGQLGVLDVRNLVSLVRAILTYLQEASDILARIERELPSGGK